MAADQQRQTAQDDAFRKIALKEAYLASPELDRALREQQRQAERGTHLAIFQAVLRLRLLTVEKVKEVLELVKQRYTFCLACGKENVRKPDGPHACKHCQAEIGGSSRRMAPMPPPPRADDPWIGQSLGGCEILDKLGEGGSGTVYRARQLALDRLVAVKLLYPWLAVKDDHARRFLREAKAMAKVEHPNVVPIYDYGSIDGAYFLVMSYQEGHNLGRHLAERGRLAADEALAIAAQVLAGLRAMHRAGVIHRDLKPDNIQITPDARAMVMDFGLVRQMEGAESLTHSEQIVGTPYYMSPEQCLNRDVDLRTDIYSLGVTIYQMLAGVRPFGGNNAVELIMSHLYERARPLDEVDSAFGPAIAAVVSRMMAKDKRARYQTAQDALDDVERLRAGKPPLALAAPRPERGAGRRAVAAAAALLVAGGLMSWAYWRAGAADLPRDRLVETAAEPPTEALAQHRFDEIRAFEQHLATLLAPSRGAAERDAGRELLRWCQLRYTALAEDPGLKHTRAAAQALERYFALVMLYPSSPPDRAAPDAAAVADMPRRSLEDAHGRALGGLRASAAKIDRLVALGRWAEAREVVALEPAPAALAAVLRARAIAHVERAETAFVTVRLARAAALAEVGEYDLALAALEALAPTTSPLRARVAARARAICDTRDRARGVNEARALERRRGLDLALAGELDRELEAGDIAGARATLDLAVAADSERATPVVDELARATADLGRCEAVRRAAGEALERQRGKPVKVVWRDGSSTRGVLTSPAPGRLVVTPEGGASRAVAADLLAPENVLALATGGTQLDRATYAARAGDPEAARARVLELAPSPERDALAQLVRRRRVAAFEVALVRATSEPGRDVVAARASLVALAELDPEGEAARAPAWRRLAVLAGETYVYVARTRELFRAEPDALDLPRWSPLPDLLRAAGPGQWVAEAPGRGETYSEAFKAPKLTYPFAVRAQLRFDGEGGLGGVVVGRPGAYVAIELSGAGRWRLWEPSSQGIGRSTPWRELPGDGSRTDGPIALELVVHQRSVDVAIGGEPVRCHDEITLPAPTEAQVGIVVRPGQAMRIYRLTAHRLVAVAAQK